MKKQPQGRKTDSKVSTINVIGKVTWDLKGAPISNIMINFFSSENEKGVSASGKTNNEGNFRLSLPLKENTQTTLWSLRLTDKSGRILHLVSPIIINPSIKVVEINVQLPVRLKTELEISKAKTRTTVKVGQLHIDAKVLETLKPETVIAIARIMVKDKKVTAKERSQVQALSPELIFSKESATTTLSGTHILESINEIIRIKGWPREVSLEIERILSMRAYGFGFATHDCGNFLINYDTSGPAAVNSGTAAEDVIDPGSSPSVVLATLPAGGDPTYIKRVCFWLERALASYTSPPFSMLNPASGGKIQV